MTPDELTDEELNLLRDLRAQGGTSMISGNKSHKGLDRLVDAQYVESRSAAPDAVIYTLTPAGAAAWRARNGVPEPKPDEWPHAFLCDCRHGTQHWKDEFGYYGCNHNQCGIEYSADAQQKSLIQQTTGGGIARMVTHDKAWARARPDAKAIRIG